MNHSISPWQKFHLRRVLAIAVVTATVLISTVLLWLETPLPARAATTPEANSYKVDHSSSRVQMGSDPAKAKSDGLVESLKEKAETVREKLNLDEPMPEGTKLFIKQLQGEDVQVNEPKPAGKGEEPLNE